MMDELMIELVEIPPRDILAIFQRMVDDFIDRIVVVTIAKGEGHHIGRVDLIAARLKISFP